MPELCRFRGIVIQMQWDDHPLPHFHVNYGGQRASVNIEGPEIVEGRLPPRVRRLVIRWARIHQDELRDAWDKASRKEPTGRIAPL